MPEKPYEVFVVHGRGAQRSYDDAQAAIAHLPAKLTVLSHIADDQGMIDALRHADGVIIAASPMSRAVMSACEGLKVVVRTGVGYDVIDVPAATDLGVVAVNVPDIWVREVANHAVALLLALNRKIINLDRGVHAGTWGGGVPGPFTGSLHGETVGIVGLGNIGSAFAKRIGAFEMTVIGYDPYVDDAKLKVLGVERMKSLEELAARADYISVHTLLSKETNHLIGEKVFAKMKPTAVLINTSRGPVVDEKALIKALEEKKLAGASLDVFEKEPVDPNNPLLKMDNVITTPHAAYFSSPAVAQVPKRCGEEVARVLSGQRPLNPINPEVYAPGAVRRAR
jgi:D-3-phosphoglycerate dehydrogenase